MSKFITLLIIVGLLIGGLYWFVKRGEQTGDAPPTTGMNTPSAATEATEPLMVTGAKQVEPGIYDVLPAQSVITWSAKKPLIDGYVNTGTIPVTSGRLEIYTAVFAGLFTLDMQNVKVGLVAKKPGQEGVLEEHLKKADFFDSATYPTAEFRIKSISPRPDSATTFTYDVKGDLTIRGITNEIEFPTKLYLLTDGNLLSKSTFEIDRTLWDIKFGSGSFFSDLGDNLIDDKVAIEMTLMATPALAQEEVSSSTSTPATPVGTQ